MNPDPEYNANDDCIAEQLLSTINQDLSRTLRRGRSLLTHLNADTSWLLSLPIPFHTCMERDRHDTKSRKGNDKKKSIVLRHGNESKKYVHILIDPWLRDSQSDVAQFFSQQWHAQDSAVQTISEVGEVIARIEDLASSGASSMGTIDMVVVSHEFTDHMHKDTLLEVDPTVPVFATSKAAGIIRSWRHFRTVVELPIDLGKRRDWRSTSVQPLPPWLGISKLGEDKIDLLYYHATVMIAFSTADPDCLDVAAAEAMVFTPHGIAVEDMRPLIVAEPSVTTLALLHGLHDVRIGPQLNLGAHNGLKVLRLTKAKYWVGTHDEEKRGGGLVSFFLKRNVVSVKQALEREFREKVEVVDCLAEVHYSELGNGESLLLE